MLRLTRPLVLFIAAAVMIVTPARADEPKDDNPFAKGTTDFSLSASYATHIRFSQAHVYNVTAAWGKYLWDNNSFSLEAQGYYAEQPEGTDVIIGGIGILGRTHLWRCDPWSIFIDGGGGVTFADNPFPTYPYEGTHFNFTGKVGFGATYQLHEHDLLTAGIRYFHLSNGQIHGPDQNPTYDSIQFWAGWMRTW